MTDPVAALREGLRDRYAFERELGRGGMATVWLARDLKYDRPVALKVLHPELAASLGPERYQREVRLAARLQHPHILTVLDSGDTAGQLWFTMPYVEGESLRDRLRRERQLPVEDALRIAREAADALHYAHEHGVIHRDIKPENLLITRDGHTLVVDFGIARSLAGAEEKLTETGLAVGTPAYMSPEQAAGDRGLDARTDLYSLATVLYEMLAGEAPFTGATAQAVIAKRLSGEIPRVRQVRPSVPEAVERAIERALAPVAADRFATMAQFAQSLQPAGIAPTAAPPTVVTPAAGLPPVAPQTTATPAARPRVPVAATALVLGILIGLGVLFAWRRHQGDATGAGGRVLAVLPFENLGDSADAYFADGVTDEVRTKLARVTGIYVIARGSSNEYRGTTKRAQEIAGELGAAYLLTGTVRWIKGADGTNRVRVTPELVEVRPGQTPRTRWGEQFDAGITDVFQVQAEIAGKVVSALDVALADSVRDEIVARPTRSVAAYDAFLKGEAAAASGTPADQRRAITYYQDAIRLDSSFALAWARLSSTAASFYRNFSLTQLAEIAHSAAERSRQLAPTNPETFVAQANLPGIRRRRSGSSARHGRSRPPGGAQQRRPAHRGGDPGADARPVRGHDHPARARVHHRSALRDDQPPARLRADGDAPLRRGEDRAAAGTHAGTGESSAAARAGARGTRRGRRRGGAWHWRCAELEQRARSVARLPGPIRRARLGPGPVPAGPGAPARAGAVRRRPRGLGHGAGPPVSRPRRPGQVARLGGHGGGGFRGASQGGA